MKFIQGVSGALIKDEKVLIIRRSTDDEFLPGYYELPGGSIEPGETKEEAVVRELQEELSLKVKVVKLYYEFSYQPGPNTKCTDYQYLVVLEENQDVVGLSLSPEHDSYKWVGAKELDTIKPITPEMLNSISLALK